MNTIKQQTEREKEENRKRMGEKDKLLSKRALQINTLQGRNNKSSFIFLVNVCFLSAFVPVTALKLVYIIKRGLTTFVLLQKLS